MRKPAGSARLTPLSKSPCWNASYASNQDKTMLADGPAFSSAKAIAPSLTVLDSLVSRSHMLLRLVRPAISNPVIALAKPRSTISDNFLPPIFVPPSCSSSHTVRNHNSKLKFLSSLGQSSSPRIFSHAAPIRPMIVLNIGRPDAPANTNVVPSVPKNFLIASSRVLPAIGLIISMKFLSKYRVTCTGYIMN